MVASLFVGPCTTKLCAAMVAAVDTALSVAAIETISPTSEGWTKYFGAGAINAVYVYVAETVHENK